MNTLIRTWNESGAFFCGFALRMLVRSGILIVFLYAFDRILRQRVRASVRYCIWLLVLVKLALPTSLSLPSAAGYWPHWPTAASTGIASSGKIKFPVSAPAAAELDTIIQPALHGPTASAGESKYERTATETVPAISLFFRSRSALPKPTTTV